MLNNNLFLNKKVFSIVLIMFFIVIDFYTRIISL